MEPLTPQSITPESVRSVQFREKLRGYHPDDVDAFVSAVAKAVESLEHRAKIAEAKLAEMESRSTAAVEAEDSLRRTLVLAQRTADAAIHEARVEADRIKEESRLQREEAEAELAQLRSRGRSAAEEEGRLERERLVAERAALLRDVAALEAHLDRERERLRIYFTDQLRRVDEGEPGIADAPEMEAELPDEPAAEAAAPRPTTTAEDAMDVVADVPGGAAADADVDADPREDDDPFLAELRRAVNDEAPLGPRDHVTSGDEAGGDDDAFDLFARGDDDNGRFGSRFRRK